VGERGTRIRTTLACVLISAFALTGCDWSQAHFGPEATNFNSFEPKLTATSVKNLSEQWSHPCACGRHPLVAGGTVYAIDGFSGDAPWSLSLRAFAADDGRERWSTPLGAASDAGSLAAVANGLVYVTVHPAAGSDRLVAVDATSGAMRWQRTPPAPGSGRIRLDPPLVDGSLVFATATASDATTVSAYDPTGRRVWTVVPGGQIFEGSNLAAVSGQTVYVATTIFLSDGGGVVLLRGYSVADGTAGSAAFIQNALPGIESLAVANGLVYGTIFTSFGRLSGVGAFAVHPETGTVAWTGELFTLAVTPGAVLSNNPRTGTLTARDPITGVVLWSTNQTDFAAAATDQLAFFSAGDIRRLSDGALVGNVRGADGTATSFVTPAAGRVVAVTPTRLYSLAPAAP
jgi:outer membrane protein assembly factor BamB